MRSLLIILDGVGCGNAQDAAHFGDEGANTLAHIFQRNPELDLPTLFSLGLWKIITADVFHPRSQDTRALWGRMSERSVGKDSTVGHWEIAGAIVEKPLAVFTRVPEKLVTEIQEASGVEFIGSDVQNGTAIFEKFGEAHEHSGNPIIYTSNGSALYIAAHESVLPSRRLYEVCRTARRCADRWRIARVVAHPFIGKKGAYRRSAGRRDYCLCPPRTVLNAISERGLSVHGIGKIGDIFARSGVTRSTPTGSNTQGMLAIETAWEAAQDGLVLANLCDFDSVFGHHRDSKGFAQALLEFDLWLGRFLHRIEPDDLVIVTADHGNDPTFRGHDHTREEVPLVAALGDHKGPLGVRSSFADAAATLAEYFRLAPWHVGKSFLPK